MRLDFDRALAVLADESGLRVSAGTARRLRRAFAAAGTAGLEALYPARQLEPGLRDFFLARVRDWLELAQDGTGPMKVTVTARGNRITLSGQAGPYQLRFAPDHSRWLLLRRASAGWQPQVPARPRTSLVDWLAEFRYRVTSRLQEVDGNARKSANGGL